MDDYVYRKHGEHIPVPYSRRAILGYGIEHHETADQETDDYTQLGGRQLGAVRAIGNPDQHQQSRKDSRADSNYQLDRSIWIYT